MSSRLRKLEEEVERQERYSRRSNVLLYGMKEEAGESFDRCTARVIKTLRRHFPQKDWNETDVERAHRLGPLSRKSDRPRPVIIKFQRWRDAIIIMRDKEGRNLMRDSDGLTKQQRDTLSQLRNQGKHAYFAKGKLVVQESRPYPNRFNSRSTHDQNPTKHAPPPPPPSPHAVQSRRNSRAASYAEAAAAPPGTRDGTSPPLDSWTEQMEDAALEEDPADDQPSDEECEVPAHLSSSVGTLQSLPFQDHLPARPLAWITHQGHVALVEAPPLAPRSRTPSAEVEAVAGGAEEDLVVQTCRPEGT